MTAAPLTPTLILVGLPDLADALARTPVPVLAADYTPDDLARVTTTATRATPVLLAPTPLPGFADWVGGLHAGGVPVAVVTPTPLPGVDPTLSAQPTTALDATLARLGAPHLAVHVHGWTLAGPPPAPAPPPTPPRPSPAHVWDPRHPSGGPSSTRRVWVVSTTGGAGATTAALGVAHHAGRLGLDTCLIDAGDGRASFDTTWADPTAPTLLDATTTGDYESTVLDVDAIRALRGAAVGSVPFALLASPVGGADALLTAPLTARALSAASQSRDLVVVDAGTLTPAHPWWDLMLADARAGGWVLIVSRPDPYPVTLLDRLLTRLSTATIPPDRTLAAFAQVRPTSPDPASFATHLPPCHWLDPVPVDDRIPALARDGRVDHATTALAPLCAQVVWLATGEGDPHATPRGRARKDRR